METMNSRSSQSSGGSCLCVSIYSPAPCKFLTTDNIFFPRSEGQTDGKHGPSEMHFLATTKTMKSLWESCAQLSAWQMRDWGREFWENVCSVYGVLHINTCIRKARVSLVRLELLSLSSITTSPRQSVILSADIYLAWLWTLTFGSC